MVAVVAVIIFPVWFPRARTLVRRWRRRGAVTGGDERAATDPAEAVG